MRLLGLLVGAAMRIDGVGKSKAGYGFFWGGRIGWATGLRCYEKNVEKSAFCLLNQKKNVYLYLKSMCDWRVCGDVLY